MKTNFKIIVVNPYAKAVRTPLFRSRVVPNKKKHQQKVACRERIAA